MTRFLLANKLLIRPLIAAAIIIGFAWRDPVSASTALNGQSKGHRFKVESIVSNLDIPWGMVFIDQKTLLFTERKGRIVRLNVETGEISPIHGGPSVNASGQGGLLDVAIPKPFNEGDWVYFTYSKPFQGEAVTTLARARLAGNRVSEWRDLLISKSFTNTSRHFGSRIAFDGMGHVFFSIGDRGHRPNGQDTNTHAGSIIRLNLDGSIPRDNPFYGHPTSLPEIWSYGHRNPQGLFYDSQRQILWSIEHGPRGGDEINQIEAGKNYGWATISFGKEYWGPVQVGEGVRKAGMEEPVKVYIPSIAPSSLIVYTGDAFPKWRGDLFAGALKLTHINHVLLSENGKITGETRLLENLGERIRALAQDSKGWIYFSTDSGQILRIRPTP